MAGTEFRRYLEAICADPSFARRRRSYVPTDLLDRQQTNRSPIEQPDFFAEFVAFDLDLNVQTAQEEKPEGLEPEKAEKIERLPVLEGIRKYAADHVLLVGKPGSGKSTALERLLVQEAELALGNVQAPIPVLLKLRDLRTSVWDLLQLSLVSRDPNLETVDLATLLTSGRLLLLWDGVNELPTGLDELKELRQRYRQTPMIFTTRTLSAGSNLGIEKKLEMQPLTEPQMRQFTCNYLGKEKGDRLIRQLEQRLREFGETPLLLWMLCGIYSKAGQIPSNLGSVFRLFVSIYDQQKGFDEKARLWQSRFLQSLAFAMMPQGGNPKGLRLSVPRSEAEAILTEQLAKENKLSIQAITALNHLLGLHLIQFNDRDRIEFQHQLFQEYFAAEYLLDKLPQIGDLERKRLYLNLLDWTESLVMLLGLVDKDDLPVARSLIELAKEVDLHLYARLAGAVKPELQPEFVKQIADLRVAERMKMTLLRKTRSEAAVPHLLKLIKSADYDSRWSIVDALVGVSTGGTLSNLLPALADPDPTIRRYVTKVLTRLGDRRSLDNLLQALEDSDPSVQYEAVKALIRIGDGQAVSSLLRVLKDETTSIFEIVAFALGAIGGEQALNGLLAILNDKDVRKRRIAVVALGNLIRKSGQKPGSSLYDSLYGLDIPPYSVQALEPASQTIVLNHLLQMLSQDADPHVRSAAAEALGKIAGEPSLTALVQALKDKNKHVRYAAARTLWHISDSSVIANLFQVLDDKDRDVRFCAIGALVAISDSDATITYLFRMLGSQNIVVRKRAVYGLREIHEFANPSWRKSATQQISFRHVFTKLCQVLKDEDFGVRWLAATTLSSLDRKQAVNELLQTLKSQRFGVRLSSASALGMIILVAALENILTWPGNVHEFMSEPPFSKHWITLRWLDAICSDQSGSKIPLDDILQCLNSKYKRTAKEAVSTLKKVGANNSEWLPKLHRCYQSNLQHAYLAYDAISAIQANCRFYNSEIEQMDLPVALEGAYSIVNQYTFPNAQEVKIFEQVDTYHDRSTDT